MASYVKSTATRTTPGTDANLVSICSGANTRFLFDAEGEMHSDAIIGVGDDWDDWDDLTLAADLSRLPTAKWDQILKYNAEDFERAGLITLSVDEEGQQHAFIKHKTMLLFYANVFRDTYGRIQQLENALVEAGIDIPKLVEVN